jgi:hypothetical protein
LSSASLIDRGKHDKRLKTLIFVVPVASVAVWIEVSVEITWRIE